MPKKTINAEQPKVEEPVAEVKTDEAGEAIENAEQPKVEEIPANVEKLMKLYPQYESFYVTKTGFVHPIEAPKYLIKDAILYKNKYFKS